MPLKRTAICPKCGHWIARMAMRNRLKCGGCGVELKESKATRFRLAWLIPVLLAVEICFLAMMGWWYDSHPIRSGWGYVIAFVLFFIPLAALVTIGHWVNPYTTEYEIHGQSCMKCGYDLRASKGTCPECGEPIPPRVGGDSSNPISRK